MTFITQNVINKKQAFTLIELLVVIILITTIYAVFLPNLSSYKISTEKITLKNIKTYLKKNFDYENELRLSCTENICYVYV
ncbi:MAG: type II secretion system protein, partial [Campylobacteraceae bacterium]|nr:type II secretion system protein [Campylobacteraceae bacterium]